MAKRRGKSRRKLAGQFCWSCNRRRPNETFSGKGLSRHLCRACAKLGAVELAYRQARGNLDRWLTWEGIIPRKRHKSFLPFLKHDDPRIRAHAEAMAKEDRLARAMLRGDLDDETDQRLAGGERLAAVDEWLLAREVTGDADELKAVNQLLDVYSLTDTNPPDDFGVHTYIRRKPAGVICHGKESEEKSQ